MKRREKCAFFIFLVVCCVLNYSYFLPFQTKQFKSDNCPPNWKLEMYQTRRSLKKYSQKISVSESDFQETEEERLRLDREARESMAEHMEKLALAESNGTENQVDRAAWKWKIRKRIWDKLESEDIADFPRPVHNRIPNFKGAQQANEQIASLPEFQQAQCVKVNPDTPQKHIRFLTLSQNKTLLVPQPRLRTGFFSKLTQATIPKNKLRYACTQAGVKEFGQSIGFDEPLPKVDMIVIGSCAVDPSTGARLGKGEGFAELEYGILRMMGVVDENTVVVTSIHDGQLVDDIDTTKMLRHDVPVDIICTPTQIVRTNTQIPKPTGIYWDLLSPEKLSQIKVLQHLKQKIEEETGEKLPEGSSEILPPTAKRGPLQGRPRKAERKIPSRAALEKQPGDLSQDTKNSDFDLFVSNLVFGIASEELSGHFASEAPVKNIKMLKGRSKGCALVQLEDSLLTESCISSLNGSELLGRKIKLRKFNKY